MLLVLRRKEPCGLEEVLSPTLSLEVGLWNLGRKCPFPPGDFLPDPLPWGPGLCMLRERALAESCRSLLGQTWAFWMSGLVLFRPMDCLEGRGSCSVLTARLEREGAGGREVEDGQSFPINESGFLGFKERQEHLGDFGEVN